MTDAQAIADHFWKSPEDSWADTFRTNVTGVYYTSLAFLPLLAKGREVTPGYTSSVINVTSISGFMKGNSSGQFAYASSKAAATHLTRMLATVFAQTKVRVNCIAPGVFPSEMTAGTSDDDNKSKLDMEMSNPAGMLRGSFLPFLLLLHMLTLSVQAVLERTRIWRRRCCFWQALAACFTTSRYCFRMAETRLYSRLLSRCTSCIAKLTCAVCDSARLQGILQ